MEARCSSTVNNSRGEGNSSGVSNSVCRRFINLATKKNKYKIIVNREFVNRNPFARLKRYYYYRDYFILDHVKPPIKILNKLSHDQDLSKCYRRFWSSIRSFKHINNKHKDTHNFRLSLTSRLDATSKLKNRLWKLFQNQRRSFKINVSFGLILTHVETGEHRFWHSSSNNSNYFGENLLIQNDTQFETFLNDLFGRDILESLERPDYKLTVSLVTNMTVYIFKLKSGPIGGFHCGCPLPSSLVKNRSVISFNEYSDTLCFFRCLAYWRNKKEGRVNRIAKSRLKIVTRQLYFQALQHFQGNLPPPSTENLYMYEKLFSCNIFLYTQKNDGCETIYHHKKKKGWDLIKLDLTSCPTHECSHVSFITNFNTYAETYWCFKCTKYFSSNKTFKKHQKEVECSTKPKIVYKNNIYDYQRDDIYHYLERRYELFVNSKIVNPYFIVYDFESILLPDNLKTGVRPNKSDPITVYTQEHHPVSCSVFSNIPGYNLEPKFFLNKGDTYVFIYEFVTYLREMNLAVEHILSRDIDRFKAMICNHLKIDFWYKVPRTIQYKFNRILYTPVISFNGQKYDLHIIKDYLFAILNQPRTIKKGNAYMAVLAENFKFLDMCNYLQAGTSYRQFLQAFNATQEKGFFPYSWLTSLNVLNETKLPPKDKFYNDLLDQPISNEDYSTCKNIWEENNMKTMVDYLKYYNNCDVVPFVESIETMVKMYRERGINLFQDAMSLPGVSLKLLFSQTRDPYLCPSNEIEYKIMSDAVIGGPSLIFSRFSECGKTYIKSHRYQNPKICKSILGLDANALYLYCIGSHMPSGLFKHRVLDTKNKTCLKTKSKSRFYRKEIKWLMVMEKELGVPLISNLSPGSQQCVMVPSLDVNGEVKPEMFFVDGYYRNPDTNERILCELYGCYFHTCLKCFGKNAHRLDRYYKTVERENKLKSLPNVKLITLWEHDYETFMNGKMSGMSITRFQYLKSLVPPTLLEKKRQW